MSGVVAGRAGGAAASAAQASMKVRRVMDGMARFQNSAAGGAAIGHASLTSDDQFVIIKHHEDDPGHRRSDSAGGASAPRAGGPVHGSGGIRVARGCAGSPSSTAGALGAPMDLAPHERAGGLGG